MKTILVSIALALAPSLAYAQDGMSINGVFYKLGMTRAEVLAATPKEVDIQDFPKGGPTGSLMFSIQRRSNLHEFLGSVDLTDGRVSRIVRQIGVFDQPVAYTVGKALADGFARIKQDNPGADIAIRSDVQAPDFGGETKVITLTYGRRQIRIVVPEPGRRVSMTIEEILQLP